MRNTILIMMLILFWACEDKSSDKNEEERVNHSENDDDPGEECLEDSDCTPENPEFSFNPGGFSPICYKNEQGGYKCTECFNNEDCGEGNRCKNETYCIGVDD